MEPPSIESRKADHIEVAASGRADFRDQGTLLACVRLTHESLPELGLEDIDLTTEFLGATLRAPILVTGMTGGTEEAAAINRDIAAAAEACGVAFGVGSQRAMAEKPDLESTYRVRDVAPNVCLIGNIGAVQGMQYGVPKVSDLAKRLDARAMAVHLNPAQEMMQAHGDRDFAGVVDFIGELVETLSVPVIVKETGCGLSKDAASALKKAGVETVDVSGAGGTSWVAVERHRAQDGTRERLLGDEYWDWGIPTAVSVAACRAQGLRVVASGGIRSGLDIARAIALGASIGGLAAPILRAQRAGGQRGAQEAIAALIESLKVAHLLTASRSPAELATRPRHIQSPLREWLDDIL